MKSLLEMTQEVIKEGLESDYILKKTTQEEVKDLLLRGHYLEAWPFAGSQFKDYIYGIYKKPTEMKGPKLNLGEIPSKNLLVGCIVYGFPEPHAGDYISKYVRQLLDPDETVDEIDNNLKRTYQQDVEQEKKAKERGYEYKPKSKQALLSLLTATNVQAKQILELKRLFILPQYDIKNIESFAIGQGNDMVFKDNKDIQAIVSFSDSRVGHHGGVYQATNALYAGINKPGLHRYVYLRGSLMDVIKKYRVAYKEIVFRYPKKSEPTKEPTKQKGLDFTKDSEATPTDTRAVKVLQQKLANIVDPTTRSYFEKVINYLQNPGQTKLKLAEIKCVLSHFKKTI